MILRIGRASNTASVKSKRGPGKAIAKAVGITKSASKIVEGERKASSKAGGKVAGKGASEGAGKGTDNIVRRRGWRAPGRRGGGA